VPNFSHRSNGAANSRQRTVGQTPSNPQPPARSQVPNAPLAPSVAFPHQQTVVGGRGESANLQQHRSATHHNMPSASNQSLGGPTVDPYNANPGNPFRSNNRMQHPQDDLDPFSIAFGLSANPPAIRTRPAATNNLPVDPYSQVQNPQPGPMVNMFPSDIPYRGASMMQTSDGSAAAANPNSGSLSVSIPYHSHTIHFLKNKDDRGGQSAHGALPLADTRAEHPNCEYLLAHGD
jgi:hypothetical protein